MKTLSCSIEFARLEAMPRVQSVEVSSSWKTLTDTCKISMPRKAITRGGAEVNLRDYIKRGDAVTVKLGYNGENTVRFEGYVSNVGAQKPLVVDCEDAMWLLKQRSITRTWATVNLADLGAALVVGTSLEVEAADVTLSAVRFNDITPARALQEIREAYGLVSYIRDGVLVLGKRYSDAAGFNDKIPVLHFQKNVVATNGLTFKDATEVPIAVRAVSKVANGTDLVVELQEPRGLPKESYETRTLNLQGVDLANLRKLAQEALARENYNGYRGSIVTFGEPPIRHGYCVELQNDERPEHNGRYLVDAVKDVFNTSGYRITSELGPTI